MKIYASRSKFEVVSSMYETRCVTKFATDWLNEKHIMCVYTYIYIYSCVYVCVCVCVCVCMCVVMILTKEQDIIILALRRK